MRPPSLLAWLCITATGGCGGPLEPAAVTFQRYGVGADADCWYRVTEYLDREYWSKWANSDRCTPVDPMFSADETGQCVKFTEDCRGRGELPEDPWLAGCEAFPECCARPITEAPLCDFTPPLGSVTFDRHDAEVGCWYQVTEILDPEYWTDWITSESCTQGDPLFSADQNGQCVKFNQDCLGGLPPDPWLAGCEAFPACCTEPITEAPYCSEDR